VAVIAAYCKCVAVIKANEKSKSRHCCPSCGRFFHWIWKATWWLCLVQQSV